VERPVTTATFQSLCPECGEVIYEGEDIALGEQGGSWFHQRCAEEFLPWEDDDE